MANYRLLSGPFIGEVVPEGQILPLWFEALDEDMQNRVKEFGKAKYNIDDDSDFPVSLDQLVEEYENSWDSEETSDPVTLFRVNPQRKAYA